MDALRNRVRILATAEHVITERGLSVPVSVIAKEAGVGVGTVYRHFPTKESLFAAILTAKMRELTDVVEGFINADDAGAAFREFFGYIVRRAARDRSLYQGLSEAAGLGLGTDGELGSALFDAESRLLRRAQDAGAVRADVDERDLKALIAGGIAMAEYDADLDRIVDIVCGGLER